MSQYECMEASNNQPIPTSRSCVSQPIFRSTVFVGDRQVILHDPVSLAAHDTQSQRTPESRAANFGGWAIANRWSPLHTAPSCARFGWGSPYRARPRHYEKDDRTPHDLCFPQSNPPYKTVAYTHHGGRRPSDGPKLKRYAAKCYVNHYGRLIA